MRPVFVVRLADPAGFWKALDAALGRNTGPIVGTVFRRHAVLAVRHRDQHFWSPHLYLQLRDPDDEEPDDPVLGRPHVHGRFAPHPHVWTMFMAIYGLILIGGIACAVWGFSVWSLGESPWILLGAPGAAALFAFVYGAAIIGQGLGAAQMYELRALVDRALQEAGEVAGAGSTNTS